MLIALNNKSYLVKDEFISYLEKIYELESNDELILIPSTINIPLVDSNKILLGSQNVSRDGIGPHTGEVSAKQLKSFGVKYCLVGHSERRIEQKESNYDCSEKIKMLLNEDIIPILCVGENLEDRKSGNYKEFINNEIRKATSELNSEEIGKLIIAYEPIYSIGTGIIPTNEEVEEVFNIIKETLPTNKLLYGGSVNDDNISVLKSIKNIDGFLIGGLSLEVDKLEVFLGKI